MPTTVESPPHSTETEQAMLGAILSDPDHCLEFIPSLQPEDFYDPAHAAIYRAILQLTEERLPIDLVTLSDRLGNDARINAAGGSAYLADLTTVVPTAANAAGYVEIIRNKALQRAVIAAGRGIAAFADNAETTGEQMLEQAEQTILALARQSADTQTQSLKQIAAEGYDRYALAHELKGQGAEFGLRTGFADLDATYELLEPGALTIIAGRPGMGKSSLALGIARNVAEQQGKTVAFFSLEMTKQQLLDRIVSACLGRDAWMLKKGTLSDEDFGKLTAVLSELGKHPLYIDDDPNMTLANLRSKARRQQIKDGLDLLVIDYLQLVNIPGNAMRDNPTNRVTEISRQLKQLASELHVPLIAVSQLSRAVENRPGNIPQLSDLRESGAIEQDAHVVLMLYREELYEEDCGNPGLTDVFVRKNRNGQTGKVQLFFDAKRTLFKNYSARTEQQSR
jgi:replicative DNA helicase